MSSSPDVEAPQPSPEERALQAEQLRILRQQSQLSELLTPILLEEAGFRVNQEATEIPNPEAQSIRSRLDFIEGRLTGSDGSRSIDIDEFLDLRDEKETLQQRLSALPANIASTRPQIERIEDPNQALREQIEQGFLDRTLAAQRGELPVNPALLSDLGQQEETLRETLRKQLGPGFETSTPGTERLDQFFQTKEEILEGARRGDLTLSEQLGIGRSRENVDLVNQNIAQAGTITGLSNPATFSSALGFFGNMRNQQFSANQMNAQLQSQAQAGNAQAATSLATLLLLL